MNNPNEKIILNEFKNISGEEVKKLLDEEHRDMLPVDDKILVVSMPGRSYLITKTGPNQYHFVHQTERRFLKTENS